MNEFQTKLRRVRGFLKERRLPGVLLSTRANFSWLSCGRSNHVRLDGAGGVASLFVTRGGVELWTSNLEEPRFREEEARGLPLAYRVHPWMRDDKGSWLPPGAGSDDGAYGTLNAAREAASLRWSLHPEEVRRYRKVGRLAGRVLLAAGRKVRPGWTENRLAAEITGALAGMGLEATVVLVGSDERLERYRHPIPTGKRIRKSVMMVLCAKGYGLIANLTRIVHFGKVPADLARRHRACLEVERAMWNASKPGAKAGAVFAAAAEEYAAQGFPGEWKKHHQGGPTGYETRDYLAVPGEARLLAENQALAWNPSITGTKTEDTVLLTPRGLEILTPTPGWPLTAAGRAGGFRRPAILERRL
jgi:Xaa-Pro aminopeptidase